MKILILNCVYKEGSTGKIVANLNDRLRSLCYDAFVCYGLGNSHYDNYSKKVCTRFEHYINAILCRLTGMPLIGLRFSNWRVYRIIRKDRPDIVHIHCINAGTFNGYAMFRYLASHKIPTVITLHAEIFHTAGCEHAFDCEKWQTECNGCDEYKSKLGSWFIDNSLRSFRKLKAAIRSFDNDKLKVTAVSPWLADRARISSIFAGYDVRYVHNGINTSIFHYNSSANLILRESYKRVYLFVTPYFNKNIIGTKGCGYIIALARMLHDSKFVVVTNRIVGEVDNLPSNVYMWGKAKSQSELAQLYSEADATILLSRGETFSMVTAESLCCGTPVVGFKAGGPESIALPENSFFVTYGELRSLADALSRVSNINEKLGVSSLACNKYSVESMTEGYIEIYNTLYYKNL